MHTHTHTHSENENKKEVHITLVAQDINKLKYEMAYMKQSTQGWSVDSSVRSFRRVDTKRMPVTHIFTFKGVACVTG